MKTRLHNAVYKSLILLLICTSFSSSSYSQAFIFGGEKAKVEAGFTFGPNFFLGDLGGHAGKGTNNLKDLNLNFLRDSISQIQLHNQDINIEQSDGMTSRSCVNP